MVKNEYIFARFIGTSDIILNHADCPILHRVFGFSKPAAVSFSSELQESNVPEKIADAVRFLFSDKPIPLWFFGDYHQLCVSNPCGQSLKRGTKSGDRYNRGIHYTPAPIVDYLTASVLDEIGQTTDGEAITILDPSCGCGSFLIAAFRYLVGKLPETRRTARNLFDILHRIYGVDVDSRAIIWTHCLLLLEIKRQFNNFGISQNTDVVPIPDISGNIKHRSYFDIEPDDFDRRINVVLGGPPFVKYLELQKNQPDVIHQLRRRFKSASVGQFDIYMPFIESLQVIHDGKPQKKCNYPQCPLL